MSGIALDEIALDFFKWKRRVAPVSKNSEACPSKSAGTTPHAAKRMALATLVWMFPLMLMGQGSTLAVLDGGSLNLGASGVQISKLSIFTGGTLALVGGGPPPVLTIDSLDIQTGALTISGWEGMSGAVTHIYIGPTDEEVSFNSAQFGGFSGGGQLVDPTLPGFRELVPVPEPSSLALLAGLCGTAFAWNRASRRRGNIAA